jgi:hypothetical protein
MKKLLGGSVQPPQARGIRRTRIGRVLAVVAFVGGVSATVGFAEPASASNSGAPIDSVVGTVTSPAEYGTATMQTDVVSPDFDDCTGPVCLGAGSSTLTSVVATSPAGSVIGVAAGYPSCLTVSGNQATLGVILTQATGPFSGTPVGTAVVAFVEDNGTPVKGHAVDYTELGINPDHTGSTCPAPKHPSTLASTGNLTVHDG